jgi:hypothetical protein
LAVICFRVWNTSTYVLLDFRISAEKFTVILMGLWQEGREGEGILMSAIVKQRKTRVRECYLETRKGSPHPRG